VERGLAVVREGRQHCGMLDVRRLTLAILLFVPVTLYALCVAFPKWLIETVDPNGSWR